MDEGVGNDLITGKKESEEGRGSMTGRRRMSGDGEEERAVEALRVGAGCEWTEEVETGKSQAGNALIEAAGQWTLEKEDESTECAEISVEKEAAYTGIQEEDSVPKCENKEGAIA